MSINKLALIRYKTIDNCLKNRFRKWTLEDLVETCANTLYEYEGITKGVSKRTIQLDIQNMRSEKLGYNAPIVIVDKKFYTYADKNYSITNNPLTTQDLGTLSEVVEVLKQFKGFGYFQEISGMINRLEDKIYKQKNKGRSYIHFEKNDLLKGLELIDPIHKSIIKQHALEIQYQSFKARKPSVIDFSPYVLKEYRNRWFVLGLTGNKTMLILALDRIISIKETLVEKYVLNTSININTYFDDVLGVTKNLNDQPQLIVIRIDNENAPYIVTKPLHSSQKILSKDDLGMTFSINVIWNFELEREILGFGEQIQILSPSRLKRKITQRLQKTLEKYREANSPDSEKLGD